MHDLLAGALLLLAGTPPELPATAATPEAFAPPGWTTELVERGDLNGDALPDAVVVLVQSPETQGDRRRVLLWLHGTPQGFSRVAMNQGLLACHGCLGMKGGDATPDLTIKDRVVSVSQWGGSRFSYGAVHRFRLEKDGRVRLIGKDKTTLDTVTGKGGLDSTNYLTGRHVQESEVPINNAPGPEPVTKKVVKKDQQPILPLVALEDVREYGE